MGETLLQGRQSDGDGAPCTKPFRKEKLDGTVPVAFPYDAVPAEGKSTFQAGERFRLTLLNAR
jgi:hypothetical protein